MSNLLQDTLREQAGAQTPPHFDAEQIMREGRAGVRRTRLTAGLAAAGVVGVLALGGVGLSELGGPDTSARVGIAGQGDEAPNFYERRPTYALGSVIHVGDTAFDVGERIQTFVQTDAGFVFTTSDGVVHLADGSKVHDIGRTDPQALYLSADDDGPLAAWVEFDEGERPALVVYDTAAGDEVFRTSDGTTPDMTALRDAKAAFVYAVDDGIVYWRTAEGMVAVDVETRKSELVLPGARGFDVLDVASGHFAHMVDGSERLRVSTDLTDPGPRMPWGWDGDLSPGARFVAVDQGDKAAVFDARTGADVTGDTGDYAFWTFYSWLDGSRVAMLGITETGSRTGAVDILECTVAESTCEVVADDVTEVSEAGLDAAIVLPIGDRLFPGQPG